MNDQVTGNDIITLPTLCKSDGAAEWLTFLRMGVKGMIKLKSRKNAPLLQPMPERTKEVKASLSLDMKTGLWERNADWNAGGVPVRIITRRVVSLAQAGKRWCSGLWACGYSMAKSRCILH